ncbi:MAG: NAD(P)/FAD-dependent oxidoreductase [Clostridia bacterium]|nr:NAD(P)/FAD-dependent oxidoreductase [Clostridia bacterium]
MQDIVIIGCGVIGAACAYELAKYNLAVTILEASSDVANGTTKANSAIIHAGYDPIPGTGMAKLNVEGNAMMDALCRRLDIPFKRVGSHVLAFTEEELITLRTLYERGTANGVPELRLLTAEETKAMEPSVSEEVKGSLFAPTAGIISPWELTLAMAEVAVRNGVTLKLNTPVTAIERRDGHFTVITPKERIDCRLILNAAGIHAGEIMSMAGDTPCETVFSRGEYYLLDKSEGDRVSSVIFQCPNRDGKGVLVAPTVHGNLIVGPNAESIDSPDTANTSRGLNFTRTQAMKSVPSLSIRDNIRNFAGIRANHSGEDFLIGESAKVPGLFNLAGIKSPGLTASPAIAKLAAEWVGKRLSLTEKQDFTDGRKVIRFKHLTAAEKQTVIAENPLYGRVICRCETVTEGEILAALRSPIPPTTINGVKRRVGAGMGRCQGGFCGPRVQEILSRELGIPMEEINLDEDGSYILTGRTKGEQIK